ncbi:MAG: aminotransferase class I/II-fold pyridoxal phosphate-dependent enzyme [Bdellovibrionota bacterium]
MKAFSKRAAATPASPIRSLAPLARKREAEGKKVWYLNIGQPDLLAPDSFYQALNNFKPQMIDYAPSEGLKELRINWAKYLYDCVGAELDPDEMIITTGASEALLFAFAACCDTGEEILTFDPTYANYIGISTLAGIRLRALETSFENNFALPPLEEIKRSLNKKTKAIMLCSPNNPTGSHYGKKTVGELSEFCHENGLFFYS